MKNIFLRAIVFLISLSTTVAYALEDPSDPSECAVNTVRGQSGAIQNPQFIMANCTKQYIRKVESISKPISRNYLVNGTIKFGMSKYYGWGGIGLVVSAKNNSNAKLIYATIEIIDKNTSKKEIYRLIASDVCEPFSMCEFVNNYSISEEEQKTFWQDHGWNFINALAIGAP